MARSIVILLLLLSISSFSQKRFTIQELIDLYTSKSKEEALKFIESKGYVMHDIMEPGVLFDEGLWKNRKGEQILFEFYIPGNALIERFGFGLNDNRIVNLVCYAGMREGFLSYKDDLVGMNFKLTKSHGPISEIFERKKTDFAVWYEITGRDTSMLSLISNDSDVYRNVKH
ncbi:MAG: hypothetical protein WAZ98_10445 [Cyclobacteriaceae bacterium]